MRSRSTLTLLASVPAILAQPWEHPDGSTHGGHQWGPWSGAWGSASSSAPASYSTGSSGGENQTCSPLTTADVEAGGNNTLFTRWRPRSHFLAPAGWMNDPCAPMYDPTRDIYHLFYQWHPQHINWGNISWGYATSKDMVTWVDHNGWQDSEAQALGPTGYGQYNGLGIFSGTGQPINLKGEVDGTLLLFYTSVAHLPTSYSISYQPYTESQSLAMSTDGGKTWEQYAGNPVINATTETAPMYWNVTGFRDPFFHLVPELDTLLGVSEPHYYAVFGSGIKGVGPRMPLWTAPASDLTKWCFLGALWEPADNTTLGPVLATGSYGYNCEVSGFFTLPDSKGNPHYFVNMGTEGGNVSFHEASHWALWNEGTVSKRENGSVQFTPIAGGAADWGLSYALTSFNDTKNNRRVQWAWAPEDLVGDGGIFSANQQGFQGSLTLPRELFVHEVDNVIDANATLSSTKQAVLTGTTAQTLGIRPLHDVVEVLLANASHTTYDARTYTTSTTLATSGSAQQWLTAIVAASIGAYGFTLAASPDGTEYTTISYQPSNHTVLVDRTHSSGPNLMGFNNATVTGFFTPYTAKN
ncbi:Arabinanase/levansucrase/invertase [Teratosphaeria nubilosa]|uniref:Arabinanase/levansucrase/invertase n=1 Tax=Teratosphaeria nubilosa TaxID=161662 RepID=A0A6G1L8B7_9PEZI|nr:Arabinanase/levansucrase/invertase [Teratosphaeria nubilosa]